MVFSLRILGRLYALPDRNGLLAALLAAGTLVGCGQKGPLFLPVPPGLPAPILVVPPGLADDSFPATVPVLPASAAR